jgi:hypothetical protein
MNNDLKNIESLYQLVEKDESEAVNQSEDSLIKKFLLFIAKVIDPTGVLSWGDLKQAWNERDYSSTTKTFLSNLRILLTLYSCVPNLGLIIGAGGGAGVGALAGGVGAAPGAVIGGGAGGTIWTGFKAVAKVLASPVALKAAMKYPKFMKAMQAVGAKASSFLRNGVFGDAIQKALADAQAKNILTTAEVAGIQKAIQFFAGGLGMRGLGTGNVLTAPKLKIATRALDTQYNVAKSALGGPGSTEVPEIKSPLKTITPEKQRELDLATGKAPLPVPEPAGPTITHVLTWDDNGNLVPSKQPLTQRQFNAMGGVGQQRMSTGETLPVMSPANVPQGATQDNRMGREGMSPYQLRRPDNFNRSLNIFGAPQSSYGQPAGGDLVGTLLQPLLGIAGNAGNFSIGAQLSPVNNFAGFAGSLINILPGLGAI